MKLPIAPQAYDRANEQQTRFQLEQEDAQNLKRGNDVEMGRGRIILTAPNGSRWVLTVGNTGTLGTTAL